MGTTQELSERFAGATLTAENFINATLAVTWDSDGGPVTASAAVVTSADFEACAAALRAIGR